MYLPCAFLLGSSLLALAAFDGCAGAAPSSTPAAGVTAPAPAMLAPFIAMAQASPCAETRNRLFLIDGQLVLWDRAGACPDNSYEQKLYGGTLDSVLCSAADSIAGPRRTFQDPSRQALFETILANLDKADLGLGPGHKVVRIPT